ncbi:hypothetical protein G6F65_019974 [Rhizopus arrhizus]|nr:hypothetical protein G6F65_019974 [Rhizopus arrhizus]
MFEHAHAGDTIESLIYRTVILQAKLQRQACVSMPRPLGLLFGYCHADALYAVVLCGKTHQAAPAATDIQQTHPGTKIQLFADQVQLLFLRGGKIVCTIPVGAGIRHARVEHRGVEVISQVVMRLSYLPRTPHALPI